MTMAETRRQVLLVVADDGLRGRLSRGLREHGYRVHGAKDPGGAQKRLAAEAIDLIVVELTDSLDALQPLLQAGPTVLAIGYGREQKLERACAAIRAGAYDYLDSPENGTEIAWAFEKAAAREGRRGDPAAARFVSAIPSPKEAKGGGAEQDQAQAAIQLPVLIAESPRMRELLPMVRKLAIHRTSVLLTGESGTGKELLARMLHMLSKRREGPLVAVNCGALPETLLESLLFGHRRGAFTDAVRDQRGLFEEAHGGTLFLDEVGELSPKLQVKLLRVLQDHKVQPLGADGNQVLEVDVRVVAATLRNLEADVECGRFRADLYYRLSVVSLHVPPLRERVEDILPLAEHFLHRAAVRLGRPLQGYTPAARQALLRYRFPGNVRELENIVERAAVLCEHTVLDAADLPLANAPAFFAASAGAFNRSLNRSPDVAPDTAPDTETGPAAYVSPSGDLSLKPAIRHLEAVFIRRALLRTRGNRSAAARLLGLSHRALLYKLRDYELDGRKRSD